MGKYFGTDGARGIANKELSCEFALKLGRAAAQVLIEKSGKGATVIIGKDTRISCDMLEGALTCGLCSVGANVILLGVVPTPAVAYLVKKYHASCGVMISASHNPYEFNGIKLFSGEGFKLPDNVEAEIEYLIDNPDQIHLCSEGEIGRKLPAPNAVQDYIDHIASTVDVDFSGIKVALDCSCGSSSVTAKKLFEKLGAQVFVIHDNPNGTNINDNCGSTHMDDIRKFTVENGCHVGLAFDGDADRCLVVDEQGHIIDGDQLIAIFAKYLKDQGKLSGNTAVVTVMSNMGFMRFAKENGIKVLTTAVGDRYVLEEMLKDRFVIGGEQSGHIIFLDYATTGDGQLTAVQFLNILKQTQKTASQLAATMQVFPQVLKNIKVDSDQDKKVLDLPTIREYIAKKEQLLGTRGRILVRASGTEPLIRIMLEGEELAEIDRIADEIQEKIRENL